MVTSDRARRIFQRLHQRGTYEGSGIGLSIAKRIFERDGARPRPHPLRARRRSDVIFTSRRHRDWKVQLAERVLIVDDNRFNVKLAQYLLTADGFEVCSAATSDEMMAAIATVMPRLILMDLNLPGTDGLTLTRQLRANPVHDPISIIAFSADVTPADEQRLRDAGCDGYISKPIDVAQFCADVRQHLATPHRSD